MNKGKGRPPNTHQEMIDMPNMGLIELGVIVCAGGLLLTGAVTAVFFLSRKRKSGM
jgi:hypothetical protein